MPRPHPASPARQLSVPPEDLPSWHGRPSCSGSGTQFLFSPFHHLCQRAVSTRCTSIPRRYPAQCLLGTCYPTSVFSFSMSSSLLNSCGHQLMFRKQPLTLQKPWTPGAPEQLPSLPRCIQLHTKHCSLCQQHRSWLSGALVGKLETREQRHTCNAAPRGSEHCLGLAGHATLGMSAAGWLQVPGEDKASATYVPGCLVASGVPCVHMIQRHLPHLKPSNYSL